MLVGACLLRAAAPWLPRVLPVRLLGSWCCWWGYPGSPWLPQTAGFGSDPGTREPFPVCSWQGLDEVTFKGPSNPNYSMIPAPHTALCSCLCSHGYSSPLSRPNQPLASFCTRDWMKRIMDLLRAQGTREGTVLSLPPSSIPPEWEPPALREGQAGSLLTGMPVWEAGRTVRKLNMDRGDQAGGGHQRDPHSSISPPFWFCSQLDPCQPPTPPLPSPQPHSPPHHLALLLSGPL